MNVQNVPGRPNKLLGRCRCVRLRNKTMGLATSSRDSLQGYLRNGLRAFSLSSKFLCTVFPAHGQCAGTLRPFNTILKQLCTAQRKRVLCFEISTNAVLKMNQTHFQHVTLHGHSPNQQGTCELIGDRTHDILPRNRVLHQLSNRAPLIIRLLVEIL